MKAPRLGIPVRTRYRPGVKVERLHLRGFLEGIEIPVVSITVSMQRDSPAMASIQIVPTPLAFMILPRTIVHVFYSDESHPDYVIGEPGAGQVAQPNTTYQIPEVEDESELVVPDVPPEYTRYRLLFVGEVMGASYVKTESQRAVVLKCQDLSNYWDSVMHDRSGGLFAPSRMPKFEGRATGAFWDLLGGDTGAVYDKLTKPPSAFPHLVTKDPATGRVNTSYMAGIMHLLEEVFGVYHRRVGGAEVISSPNPFAAMAELRLRLLQQIGIPPGDSTPLRLMASQGFGSLWRTSIRGLPRQFNFRTLMQALMQYTFYAVYPLSTPSYQPPSGDYAKMMGWVPSQDDAGTAPEVVPVARSYVMRRLGALKAAVDRCIALVPRTAIGIQEREVVKSTYDQALSTCADCLSRLQVDPRWASARQAIRHLDAVARASMLLPWWSLQTSMLTSDLAANLDAMLAAIDRARQALGARPSRPVREDVGTPAFLYTQLFRPDIWFCPPPRCNVLFPDQVSSMTYDRNFFSEPTRLMIKGYSAFLGSVPFFDNWYFAPTAAGLLRDRPIVRRSGGSAATGDAAISSDLMAHEIYTGIVPFFQSMSDREMTIGKNVLRAGKTEDKVEGQALDYFQRVTNYLFFKTRFSARTISLQCRFNPYLVPGFPGLVLNAPTSHIETRSNEMILEHGRQALEALTRESTGEDPPYQGEILDLLKGRTGVHFLGIVETVSHTMDAAGRCGTSVVLGYARDHRESVEFFGQDVQEARRRRRLYRYIRRQVEADDPRRLGIEAVAGSMEWAAEDTRARIMEPVHGVIITPEDSARARSANLVTGPVLSAAEALRQYASTMTETVRGEVLTDRKWTVAAFADRPPVVGALGPWGGPIKEVRDITDQFATGQADTTSPAARRRLEAIDGQLEEVRKQLLIVPLTDAARADLVAREAALERQRSTVRQRTGQSRVLPLFGVYPDGTRLPSPSIPAHLIGTDNPASAYGPDVVSVVGSPNTLVTLHAYEFVEDISGGADTVDFPVEDVVRPPWFPDIWLNGRIGGGVYLPLLGVGAITDPLAVMRKGALPEAAVLQQGLPAMADMNPEEDGEASPEVIGSIMHGATVQGAVDFLAHTYSAMRDEGLDVADFCSQYTWRPIATMFDLFGSADLRLKPDGVIERGIEGFHSRAFGPYADLFGLAPADTTKLLGVELSDVAARARLDVRGRRHVVIQAYRQELLERRVSSG